MPTPGWSSADALLGGWQAGVLHGAQCAYMYPCARGGKEVPISRDCPFVKSASPIGFGMHRQALRAGSLPVERRRGVDEEEAEDVRQG